MRRLLRPMVLTSLCLLATGCADAGLGDAEASSSDSEIRGMQRQVAALQAQVATQGEYLRGQRPIPHLWAQDLKLGMNSVHVNGESITWVEPPAGPPGPPTSAGELRRNGSDLLYKPDAAASPISLLAGTWTTAGGDIYFTGGSVGVGTAMPAAALDVAGGLRIGDDTGICDASKSGALRWDGSLDVCNSDNWTSVPLTIPPDWEDDFTSYADQTAFDAVWVPQSTRLLGDPAGNKIDCSWQRHDNINDAISVDVETHGSLAISQTAFVLRIELDVLSSTTATTGNEIMIGLSSLPSSSNNFAPHDFVGLHGRVAAGGTAWQVTSAEGIGILTGTRGPDFPTDWNTATPTSRNFEMILSGGNLVTINDYGTDDTFTTVNQSQSVATSTGVTDSLKYLWIGNSRDNSTSGIMTGRILSVKFWNGISSLN